MTVDEQVLRQRLRRVQALHDGATTPGERRAAAQARERIVARLQRVRNADPVARFVHRQVEGLGVGRPPEPPSVPLPSHREVGVALAHWEMGRWSDRRVSAWAAALVDAVDLPSHPDAVGACRAEVLLQLAMLHRVPLRSTDVPALRRFLRTRDWAQWFELVAEVAAMAG